MSSVRKGILLGVKIVSAITSTLGCPLLKHPSLFIALVVLAALIKHIV